MQQMVIWVRITPDGDWKPFLGPTESEEDAVGAAEAILFTSAPYGYQIVVEIRAAFDEVVWRKDWREFLAERHERMQVNPTEVARLRAALAIR